MTPTDTVTGKTVFDGFRVTTKEDFDKKVKAFIGFLKQMFPKARIEKLDSCEGVTHIQMSGESRCVIFPIYNGYIELGGVNFSFDSDGCISVLNSLSYYMQMPMPDMKNRRLRISV